MVLFVTTPNAVELSVCINISGWGWPSSVSVCLMGAMNFALMYNAPSSASAADDMTAFITYAELWIAPLFNGNVVLLDMKKCPPALLLAYGLFRNEASLWTANIILLTL